MQNTVSLSHDIVQSILAKLHVLQEDMTEVKERLEAAPSYGSKEWWKWSDKKALEDIEAGKGTIINNKKGLDKFFASL